MHIPLAARSKPSDCARSRAGTTGSNRDRSINVCLVGVVLPGRGLCDGLLRRTAESYSVCVCVCVCVCVSDLETSKAAA